MTVSVQTGAACFMDIFLDTACIDTLRTWKDFVQGVTTNPSLMARQGGGSFQARSKEILALAIGPVSLEVLGHTAEEMVEQGRLFVEWGREVGRQEDVVVKVPLTFEGLKACARLRSQGIAVNVTLCFSVAQGLLAAKAGATYVSPFVGRLDDNGIDGMGLVRDLTEVYETYGYDTQILAASIRTVTHVTQAALAGADAATIPLSVLQQMDKHVLTDKGLQGFDQDGQALAAELRDCLTSSQE